MNTQHHSIIIELISETNKLQILEMMMGLWPGSDRQEELSTLDDISGSPGQFCALARYGDAYVGFIHLAIRSGYVEGSGSSRTAYLEGIFVQPDFRNLGIARLLLLHGEQWVRSKGLNQVASDREIDNKLGEHFHLKAGFTEVNRIVCYLKKLD